MINSRLTPISNLNVAFKQATADANAATTKEQAVAIYTSLRAALVAAGSNTYYIVSNPDENNGHDDGDFGNWERALGEELSTDGSTSNKTLLIRAVNITYRILAASKVSSVIDSYKADGEENAEINADNFKKVIPTKLLNLKSFANHALSTNSAAAPELTQKITAFAVKCVEFSVASYSDALKSSYNDLAKEGYGLIFAALTYDDFAYLFSDAYQG